MMQAEGDHDEVWWVPGNSSSSKLVTAPLSLMLCSLQLLSILTKVFYSGKGNFDRKNEVHRLLATSPVGLTKGIPN